MGDGSQPPAEWVTLMGRVQTAARLAPLTGPSDRSLPGRAWSRVRSTAALLLTARQKRFNIEAADALAGVCRQLESLAAENAALRAELADLRADLEPPHLRPGTLDAAIWTDVNRQNEYALPDRFEPGDLVVDIGGHIGSFSFACLRRGAGAVVCFEPNPANAALAELNLKRFGPRAEVRRAAVWRSDRPAGTLTLAGSADATNTGGGGIGSGDVTAPAVPFDEVLNELMAVRGGSRVRLLKLDCEGSEYPILFTSRSLDRIDAICGEYHETEGPFPDQFRVAGHDRYDRHELARFLTERGFRVDHRQHTSNPLIGLFFATRQTV
ncbi:MAG: FkbM family methyltransferase [Gemmataceae bacterium]